MHNQKQNLNNNSENQKQTRRKEVRCTLVTATANTVTKISVRSVIVQNCKHSLTQLLPGSIWRQAMR